MDNLISRAAAIEALLTAGYINLSDGQAYFLEKALNEIPSAEVTLCHLGSPCEYQNADIAMPSAQQWIPCKERMPDDLEEVNVTWVNHDPEPYYNFVKDKPFTATAVYYKEKWYWYSSTCADLLAEYGRNPVEEIDDGIEIIAWMPLPNPWRGEDNDSV